MGSLTPEQEKFNGHFQKLLIMTFQDALKWLYSEGWYFQTEPEAWKSNSALFQDINTNGIFGHSMDDIHPAEVNYLYFKSLHMKTGVLMRQSHGIPNDESNAWPNDVIKHLINVRYDAINKRKI